MSEPWLKFYPTDWRADPALKMCSLAARGLWIEMIALMHEATPYGHLIVSGRSPTDAQLAVLAGALPEQVSEHLGELESAGVFSRTREGVIYSRKMTRIAKKAAIARKNGKNGGNPNLCKEKENKASDNQNQTDTVKPQKPEARSQTEKDADASFETAPEQKAPRSPPRRASAIPDGWVPSDRNLSDARSQNFTEAEIHDQAAAFRDYHLARGTAFKDWDAAWRTWLGNARRFARSSPAPGPRPRSAHDGMLAGFQRAAAGGRG